MRIGIACDLKADGPTNGSPPGLPDDLQEEFDSPVTIEAIARALRGLGHDVETLGDGRELLERLLADPPDFVFNMAEGQGVGRAREARVPAVLEMLGIPYSGSDPLTLAVSLDKDCAKRLVRAAGGTAAWDMLVSPGANPAPDLDLGGCRFPVIVKPAWEGSSKGIRGHCLVDRPQDLPAVLKALGRDYGQPILVEEYVHGEEITVGILGNREPEVLGVMRVLPREPTQRFVYSLEIKRDFMRRVRYECPPQLPDEVVQDVARAATTAFQALGCRDVARVDFRVRDGVPYFLEINPLPGLNPDTSDLVIMAGLCGWSHARLIEAIFHAALERHSSAIPSRAHASI
jgi:D-alanine-D-alanine ligase